ncbi:MAG: NfeD family protein, partial [Elusimicrobiota bacterium]
GLSVSWSIVAGSIGGLAALSAAISYIVYRSYRRRPASGMEGMVGEVGKTVGKLDPEGQVSVHGEIWDAESVEGRIGKGVKVVVQSCEGLHIKVRKK